jgi:hypothetical protein
MAPLASAPAVRSPVASPALHPVERIGTGLPNLETTQTIRALTPLELEDESALQWFVIQLSTADEDFDPDSLPNIDIFNMYRLYAVVGFDQGRLVHALRLGFFTEEIAARAVASYLAAYYENPTIKRVSAAERERFAHQRIEARMDIGATGRHAVIEITNERVVRENRAATVAVPAAAVGKPSPTLGRENVVQKGLPPLPALGSWLLRR